MYQAYDRHRWEAAREPRPGHSPLDFAQLDPRTLVHPLIFCPPLAQGTRYLLVQRNLGGARVVLGIGRAQLPHPVSNLAEVRQRGARLGAGEVFLLPS
jgi:hypothetical protein